MASDLVIALAGGAIGSVATVGLRGFAVASLTASEVRFSDRKVDALNEDLQDWFHDRNEQLRAANGRIDREANAQNLFYSGHRAQQIADAKTDALRDLRDELKSARRAVAEVRAQERWRHSVFRWIRFRPVEAVEISDETRLMIGRWREAVEAPGSPIAVFDPSTTTVEQVLRHMRRTELDPRDGERRGGLVQFLRDRRFRQGQD